MKNFWQNLSIPFLVQAPMDDVTDTVFRQILATCGAPDVFFTEFANTDGLCSSGKDRVMRRLQFTPSETPLIAQIWGNNPTNYTQAVKDIKAMGFAGIDINMGCPDRKIVSKGCCSGLINNPNLAKEIFLATKEAAGDLPVSIKTRIGYSHIQTEEWIGFLLALNPDAITIHGRTTKEMSKVPAHWDEIGKVVTMRNALKSNTIIIGNGDVQNYQDAIEKHQVYGVDGIMIGRGIFHNLWIFNTNLDPDKLLSEDKLKILLQHIELFVKTWGTSKDFNLMKKFYKIYINGSPHASDLRMKLMEYTNAEETIAYINNYLLTNSI